MQCFQLGTENFIAFALLIIEIANKRVVISRVVNWLQKILLHFALLLIEITILSVDRCSVVNWIQKFF